MLFIEDSDKEQAGKSTSLQTKNKNLSKLRGSEMEEMKVAISLTDEAEGKQGIRIECEDEVVFNQVYEKFLNIQPKIMEDHIFKTAKRLIIDASYITDLEKLAEDLLKIDKIKYKDFFNNTIKVKSKININETDFFNYHRLK